MLTEDTEAAWAESFREKPEPSSFRANDTAQRPETSADLEVAFTFEERERSRWHFLLADGREAAFLIEWGTPLLEGDRLGTAEGLVLAVRAKPEPR